MTVTDDDFQKRASAWQTADANASEAELDARAAERDGAPADQVDALRRQAAQLRLLANEMHDRLLLSARATPAASRRH